MIEANLSELEQLIREAEELVVLQFWRAASDSCVQMTRRLTSVINDPSVPFRVVRVRMDGRPGSPNLFGVHAVPTLLIFNRGELREQIIGLPTEEALREKLESAWCESRRPDGAQAVESIR